jgi:hypothetical protein
MARTTQRVIMSRQYNTRADLHDIKVLYTIWKETPYDAPNAFVPS